MDLEVAYEVEISTSCSSCAQCECGCETVDCSNGSGSTAPALVASRKEEETDDDSGSVTFLAEYSDKAPQPNKDQDDDDVVFLGEFRNQRTTAQLRQASLCKCCDVVHQTINVPVQTFWNGERIPTKKTPTSTYLNATHFPDGSVTSVQRLRFFPEPPESQWLPVPVYHQNPFNQNWHRGKPDVDFFTEPSKYGPILKRKRAR